MADILIIRHGEPVAKGVFLGALDSELSPHGHAQAEALLTQVSEVVTVYASPLKRALQTARHLGKPIVTLDDLREIGYGDWEGLTWEEVEARDPETAKRKAADWFGEPVNGAETWAAFEERVRRAYGTIVGDERRIAVVAHLGVNSLLHQFHSGVSAATFVQNYCETIKLKR